MSPSIIDRLIDRLPPRYRLAAHIAWLPAAGFILFTGCMYLADPPSLGWHHPLWLRIGGGIFLVTGSVLALIDQSLIIRRMTRRRAG